MPSPLNTPSTTIATAVTTAGATEILVVTSGPVNCDNLETIVNIECAVDFLNSASGTTMTWRIRRGTVTGAVITSGSAWGPFTLTASARSNFVVMGVDLPGLVHGQVYVLTMQIASNAATATVETAAIQAWPSAAS